VLKQNSITFEEALQSDENLLKFWLQGQNYAGAWESLRVAIVQHINEVKHREQIAPYNKVDLFQELEKMNTELAEMKNIVNNYKQITNQN